MFRYASVEVISADFITQLIYNEQQDGIFNVVKETGVKTWEGMVYLPVPIPEEGPREVVAADATESTPQVILTFARGSVS